MDDPVVKLRRNGQIINLSRLPDEIVEAIHEAFRQESDPFTILAAYAYIFSGLSIDEIRELFVLADNSGTRIASREYVRQRIRTIYIAIRDYHREHYGEIDITTIFTSGPIPLIAGAIRAIPEEEEFVPDETEEQEKSRKCKAGEEELTSITAGVDEDFGDHDDPGD
jgi:hypothetical protein